MKTNLSRLSVGSLGFFCMEVIDYSDKTAAELVANHPLLTSLKNEYGAFKASIDKQAYSGKGKVVAKANATRTDLYLSVRLVLRGYAKAQGFSGQKEARELLKLFVVKGKNVSKNNYNEKSTDLYILLRELSKPEQIARIEKLGLTEMIQLLEKGYNDFEDKVGELNSANAELRGLPTATKLRTPLEKSLRNYLNFVKAMSSVDERWESAYYFVQEVAPTSRSRKKKSTDVEPGKVE